MLETVTAIYENGILRPLQPLSLQEHQKVRLQILPVSTNDEVDQAIQTLVEAGLLTPPLGRSEVEPVTEEEQLRVAKTLGRAAAKKPLSEIIIEDRGEW